MNFYLPKEKCPQFPNVVKTSGALKFLSPEMLRIRETYGSINSVKEYHKESVTQYGINTTVCIVVSIP